MLANKFTNSQASLHLPFSSLPPPPPPPTIPLIKNSCINPRSVSDKNQKMSNINMCNANLYYVLHQMLAMHFCLLSFIVEVNATIAIPEQRVLQ